MTAEVLPYTLFGREFLVEDRAGHAGAAVVAAELRGGAYGLAGLGLGPGDTVVDVGAHVGLVSLCVAALYPGVRVVAVEPDPDNFDALRRNVRRDLARAVEPVHLGVSGDGRPAVLRRPRESVGSSAWLDQDTPDPVAVPTLTLPRLFDAFGVARAAWLKLDCEGAEVPALLACGPAFFARVGRLAVEAHASNRLGAAGFTPRRLYAHLDAHGVRYEATEVRFAP